MNGSNGIVTKIHFNTDSADQHHLLFYIMSPPDAGPLLLTGLETCEHTILSDNIIFTLRVPHSKKTIFMSHTDTSTRGVCCYNI